MEHRIKSFPRQIVVKKQSLVEIALIERPTVPAGEVFRVNDNRLLVDILPLGHVLWPGPGGDIATEAIDQRVCRVASNPVAFRYPNPIEDSLSNKWPQILCQENV